MFIFAREVKMKWINWRFIVSFENSYGFLPKRWQIEGILLATLQLKSTNWLPLILPVGKSWDSIYILQVPLNIFRLQRVAAKLRNYSRFRIFRSFPAGIHHVCFLFDMASCRTLSCFQLPLHVVTRMTCVFAWAMGVVEVQASKSKWNFVHLYAAASI